MQNKIYINIRNDSEELSIVNFLLSLNQNNKKIGIFTLNSYMAEPLLYGILDINNYKIFSIADGNSVNELNSFDIVIFYEIGFKPNLFFDILSFCKETKDKIIIIDSRKPENS